MEDVTSLVLKVESGQVTLTRKELDRLSGSSVRAEKTTDKVTGAFKRLLGPLLATISAYKGLQKLVSTTREFDILNAQLITATGSAENAAIAFGAIQDFATNTPFQLQEVTEAFVQLVNRGLDPSEESLTNVGNFASAFGRNILDATRAIGQATTGEFESLKQFGIVARKVGDEVNFTFRGITKTVKFNAREIQGYMNELAEENFTGAMEERMNTLDGALSNLADAWDKFWLSTSQTGLGSAAEETTRLLIMALEELDRIVSDSKAGQLFNGLALSLKLIREDMSRTDFAELADEITKVGVAIDRYGNMKFRSDKLDELLQQYEDTARGLDRAGLGQSIAEVNAEILAQERSLQESLEKLNDAVGTKKQGIASREVQESTARLQVLREMLKGLTGTLADFSDQSAEAEDRLAAFVQSGDLGGLTGDLEKAFEKLEFSGLDKRGQLVAKFEQQEELLTQVALAANQKLENIMSVREGILSKPQQSAEDRGYLETLQLEQDETLRIIEKANQTKLNLEEKFQEDLAALQVDQDFERLRESLLTEEEAIQESYEKRKQIILDSTLTTEDEKAKIMARLEKAHAEEIRAFEMQRWNTALSSFDDFQNNLLVLARTGSNELAGIYKAAAIANTIIKTYESATSAYAAMAGIPIVGPALGAAAAAAAVAAGLANVQAIASQQVGNYASGGIVPGNNFNGDNLNAGVNSGEMILNFSQQKRLLDMAEGKGGGGSRPVVVNVQNFGNSDVEVTEEDAGEERIINIAVGRAKRETKREIASEIRTGTGDVSRSMESSYNLKRGTG